jgi:cell wall-associated NlpC family hydrolase
VQPERPRTATRLWTRAHRLTRSVAVLAACVAVAGVSLAAAGGKKAATPTAAVVSAARAHLGDTYTWAGTGPDTWDCSGLTSTLWREVGGVKAIPRTSRQQQAWAVPIPEEQALPGDLAFFGEPVSHVGIISGERTTRATRTTPSTTTLLMVDASSSRKGVVERTVWTSGTVRFGRVPRPGMVRVKPWTPPVVVPPAPVVPTVPPVTGPVTPTAKGLTPLPGLPQLAVAGSPRALKAVRLAQVQLGSRNRGDALFLRELWKRAGGPMLPSTRDGLIAKAKPVTLKNARVGDLVVYGPPASHVGIYVGHGMMIDDSRSLGKVVLRKVWASSSVRLVRLAG